jgi:gamma-glutamyl:cysteine ligase YbdK (ATP-grasp superfamily)
MSQENRLHSFEAYGVELEYMIVDRDTLAVKPITDELIKSQVGAYESDFENGIVTWSNELVLHVIELKSTRPESNFHELEQAFAGNVKKINAILATWNAMLMPAGAHPFMNPHKESKLWPHSNNEIYDVYNKVFDCRGHGWSNLQSTHLNLPFYDDSEFSRLHAAIRMVLPLLPALCASTPILDAKITGTLDTRLRYYKTNQAKIPSITGKIIPEPVFSAQEYAETIYSVIEKDIAPFNDNQLLDPVWVNSRGAIARFDRGSIEIRVMDCQECPCADVAILSLVIETIKAFVREDFINHKAQMNWSTDALATLLDKVTISAQDTLIDQADYLEAFGVQDGTLPAKDLWKHIFERISPAANFSARSKSALNIILQDGTLAQRIVKSLEPDYSSAAMSNVYRRLCESLEQNTMFVS